MSGRCSDWTFVPNPKWISAYGIQSRGGGTSRGHLKPGIYAAECVRAKERLTEPAHIGREEEISLLGEEKSRQKVFSTGSNKRCHFWVCRNHWIRSSTGLRGGGLELQEHTLTFWRERRGPREERHGRGEHRGARANNYSRN
jgi:hypothetical protein